MTDFTFDELERMALAVSKSKLWGMDVTPEIALTAMLLAQSEGRHPMSALSDYDIMAIPGRTPKLRLKSEVLLRRFQDAGGEVEWHELSEDAAEATFRFGKTVVRLRWDMKRVHKLGLMARKGTPWQSGYTREMLRSRVIGEGTRSTYPAITGRLVDEDDGDDDAPPPTRATATERLDAALGAPSQDAQEILQRTAGDQAKLAAMGFTPTGEALPADVPEDPKQHATEQLDLSTQVHEVLDRLRQVDTEKALAGLVMEMQRLSKGRPEVGETLKHAYAEQRHILRSQGLTEKRRLFLAWIRERPDVSYEMVEDYIRNTRAGQTVATIHDNDLASIRDELTEVLARAAQELAGGQEPEPS